MAAMPDATSDEPIFLLITRNYPPKVGGLEAYSYNLISEFERRFKTFKLTLSRSNGHLVWFLPYCFLAALYHIWAHRISHVHLCDAMLSPIGLLLKILTGVRMSTSVAGLDITYDHFLYQMLVPRCVNKMNSVICISKATRNECTARGVHPGRCCVIPVGIRLTDATVRLSRRESQRRLEARISSSLKGKKLLVTVGRLVKRKGVAWFVEHVMPALDEAFLYVIVGDGPDRATIIDLIRAKGLSRRTFLLGQLSDDLRDLVLGAADLFVMPNIPIAGDIEGFGIVALEAGMAGLPVIASDMQGIRDAVIQGQTGFLVEACNPEAFIQKINTINLEPQTIRRIVTETFAWPRIAERYFDELLASDHHPESPS
jgi:glycosyltransferase involved in cell wall biosynthesis